MRNRSIFWIAILIILSTGCFSCHRGVSKDTVAVLETSYGRIVIELYPDQAPKHVANFVELTEAGFYDGTKFHRIVGKAPKLVAIQGGDPNTVSGDPSTWGQGQPGQKTVPAEFSNTLKHVRGVVSAARKSDINSATSQFFICVAPEPQWDQQGQGGQQDRRYSIFGHVVEGMNVVDTIAHAPEWPNSDRPLDPVVVTKAYITKRSELKD
ncbi:MAG TPA: peptidylprolyl isomerase [Blastocatellia bacterium]